MREHSGVIAMAYEPIIRYAPIIVPIVLAAGIIAVTVYRPPGAHSAPAVADAVIQNCSTPSGRNPCAHPR